MRIISCFSGLLFLAVSMVSCHRSGLVAEEVEQNFSVALEEGSADSLHVDIMLEWPVKGLRSEALHNIRKDIVSEVFGYQGTSEDVRASLGLYLSMLEDRYRKENYDLKKMLDKEGIGGGVFSWDEMINGSFLEPYEDMQSYLLYRYEYTGGAHGIDFEKGLTFNIKDGRSIKEEDLFSRDYKVELSRLLTARLPESVSKDVYDMLFVKTLEPNGNFYVTPAGVTYIYGRYEVGPYVLGIIRVTLPWGDLEGLR